MGFGTKRNEYSAKLGPNDTASVCFRDSGEVKYVVRAASGDPIGEQNIAGTIQIGGNRAARESPREKEEQRSAQQQPEEEPSRAR